MQTVGASDANRHFSNVLKQVAKGEEFLVISRGKPVATITPVREDDPCRRAARGVLMQRLHAQEVNGGGNWSRDELYDRTNP